MTATLPSQNPLDNITYEDLYRRWEIGNWRAMEIDFSTDAVQWQNDFTDLERRAAFWNYCLFFYGEDAVADGLSPYVDAGPARGAEVLPHHPAGRRSPPRRFLQPLHEGSRRGRRRDDRGGPRRDAPRAHMGL